MDEIKALIKKLADKVQSDDEIKELFKKDPVKAVEKILGVDLPDDVVKKIIDGVKASITIDDAKDLLGSLKKLF
ncbi:MAG: hypothetical protein IKK61_08895 [Clostridia bacterium]|nr:hypothetical protein [Clostridia bacterium]